MTRSTSLERVLDLWAGIPLVLVRSAARRRRQLPVSPGRIGVLSPTAIGDLILGTGVLTRLAAAYPHGEIHLFHGPNNAGVVPLLPVKVFGHRCVFGRVFETLRSIRREKLDVLIDLTPWPRLTALLATFSGAATVGFRSERQYRHYAFDLAVAHLSSRHETENLAAMADVFLPGEPYVVRVKEPHSALPPSLQGERMILCHVSPGGTRADAKCWPADYWAELLTGLAAEGYAVGFTGVATDEPRVKAILNRMALPGEVAFSLCGRLTLAEVASALKLCRLFITVDTGVMHLASALQVPMVALLGPTHSSRWGSRSPRARNLDAPHSDAGFIHLGFEDNPNASRIMSSLTVGLVRKAVDDVLTRAAAAESRGLLPNDPRW